MDAEPPTAARVGVLHQYSAGLNCFEYKSDTASKAKPHALLLIAGLSDGLCTVPFMNDLAGSLESTKWSVFFVMLSSSHTGWGMSSLDKDVEELGRCIDYVKALKARENQGESELAKIAIMGHSTGSQDVLHYLYTQAPEQTRPAVDGAILQAPVSDRESTLSILETGTASDSAEVINEIFYELVDVAKSNPNEKDNGYILPIALTSRIGFPSNVAVSSKRFLSLTSPDSPESPLEDDLFSSDLEDKRLQETFGMIGKRGYLKGSILVLPGGSDEYIPEWVDMESLIKRWETATKAGSDNPAIWDESCGVVPGARHSPQGKWQVKPIQDLLSRVQGFLTRLEKH
ncbi:dolichol-phosphate mannosyltransferase [Nannizzia gypsea CBS 118893]|uniref:Dolichol-phosphate mannosyltransferase n=1 Tax=Arthroderma gypseum (strain ATCC MYA-4604 / CBS 118893) TaxID=535722 RepID=E5QZF5_ARTGP|nr:dolichol-phosphate mannosyltransferase [Nannizzia gypsea CBS 118893]EFQ98173.1 dolichol-phosphate mannosyltransferase [Nannizzia gypsea CBS 118893]